MLSRHFCIGAVVCCNLAIWRCLHAWCSTQLLLPRSNGYEVLDVASASWKRFKNERMARRVCHALAESIEVDEPEMYKELRRYTQDLFPGGVHMLPSNARGRLLKRLVTTDCAMKVLEVGTFTGYSALCFAEAGAKVMTLERCPIQAEAAREFLENSGAKHRIRVLQGLAQELLPRLGSQFEVIHLDGSMKSYQQFLDLALDASLLAQNGLVLADNVLFRGLVAKVPQRNCTEFGQSSTRLRGIAEKLHRFNLHFLQEDPRTEGLILNQDDGLAIIWRRS